MASFLQQLRAVGLWQIVAVASITVHVVGEFAPVTVYSWLGAFIGASAPPVLGILWERRQQALRWVR